MAGVEWMTSDQKFVRDSERVNVRALRGDMPASSCSGALYRSAGPR